VCVVLVFEGKPKPSLLEFSICIHDPMRRAAARGQAALERETQGLPSHPVGHPALPSKFTLDWARSSTAQTALLLLLVTLAPGDTPLAGRVANLIGAALALMNQRWLRSARFFLWALFTLSQVFALLVFFNFAHPWAQSLLGEGFLSATCFGCLCLMFGVGTEDKDKDKELIRLQAALADREEAAQQAADLVLRAEQRASRAEQGLLLCKICYERDVGCVLEPCRHHAFCSHCALQLFETDGLCPLCRSPVNSFFETYSS
ncbi:unnamed protein product, partial [Effrenium voratum]